jgi:competence ComEA-like helix-hairpin-helix protein
MKHASLVFGLSLLVGCNANNGDAIDLEWKSGQEFHVAAKYRVGTVRTEEGAVSLDGTKDRDFGEQWTEDVVWTYQVVETGFVPAPSDELYEYAETHDGVASLAVLRAFVDGSLNDDSDLLQTEPVVYLVFLEDRDRLAALISYAHIDGERVERAYSSSELGGAWSTLSQSQLTSAPSYLAPFGIRHVDEERIVGNGETVETVTVDNGVVDAFFDDQFGGGLVATRYERNQPWPTWTLSDNMESVLLTAGDVDERRSERPMAPSDVPENFNYREALQRAVDIDSALFLDVELVGSGAISASTPDDYKPWAGNWWPQSKGELIFGYKGWSSTDDTISDFIREDIDPLKKDMDKLSKSIRDMEDGAEKSEKRKEYSDKQEELVGKLVGFYNGILQGLDGGSIVIENGRIRREATEGENGVEGFDLELDGLSPLDKFSVQMYLDGNTNNNPFFLPAWEILNQYSPAGGSWWGHCNGWAAAAILTHEPTESMTVDKGGQSIEYTTADLKGLLTESHYSTRSQFYGARYYKEGDDLNDLTPQAFHKLITFFIGTQKVPLVFDTTATEEVWNFPAYAYDMTVEETTSEGASERININTADYGQLLDLPGVGVTIATRILEMRNEIGSFQTVEQLKDVNGIGDVKFEELKDLVSVTPFERTFRVETALKFTTDGVDPDHVDGDNEPRGFTNRYGYTLSTDENGRVIKGEWDDEKEHPDFAWIPYENPTFRARGGSENPYLVYSDLLNTIGDEWVRK